MPTPTPVYVVLSDWSFMIHMARGKGLPVGDKLYKSYGFLSLPNWLKTGEFECLAVDGSPFGRKVNFRGYPQQSGAELEARLSQLFRQDLVRITLARGLLRFAHELVGSGEISTKTVGPDKKMLATQPLDEIDGTGPTQIPHLDFFLPETVARLSAFRGELGKSLVEHQVPAKYFTGIGREIEAFIGGRGKER